MTSTAYWEILHRGMREDPSLMEYTTPEDIEVFENTGICQYFDILCASEDYEPFVLHCVRSISDFSCDLEWL